jgi:hypothetical protein
MNLRQLRWHIEPGQADDPTYRSKSNSPAASPVQPIAARDSSGRHVMDASRYTPRLSLRPIIGMLGHVVRSLPAGIAAVLMAATTASAADPTGSPTTSSAPSATPATGTWRGFYMGGGGVYSNVSVNVGNGVCSEDCYWGEYDQYDQGDGAFGYSLHAGLRVHRFIALEVNYVDPGSIGWNKNLVYMPEFNDYYNNRVDFQASVTEASILGIFPLDPFEIYLRLGAGFWDGQSTQRLDQSFGDIVITRDFHDSGTDLLLGVGFGVTIAKGLHVRLDLQTVGIDRDVLNAQDDTSLDSFLLEVQYRFGAH